MPVPSLRGKFQKSLTHCRGRRETEGSSWQGLGPLLTAGRSEPRPSPDTFLPSVDHCQSSQAHLETAHSEWVIVSILDAPSLCLSLCAPAHGEGTRRGLCLHFPKITACTTEPGSFLGGQHRPHCPWVSPPLPWVAGA